MNYFFHQYKFFFFSLLLAVNFLLAGCSFIGEKNPELKSQDLGVNVPIFPVKQVWSAKIGAVDKMPLAVRVNGAMVTVASADGVIAAIDDRTGKDIWRAMLKEP